jgi:hypothetical protein
MRSTGACLFVALADQMRFRRKHPLMTINDDFSFLF